MKRFFCLVLLVLGITLFAMPAPAEEGAGWQGGEIVPPAPPMMKGWKMGRMDEMSPLDPEKIAGYSADANSIWREIEVTKTKRRLDGYLAIASAAAIALAVLGGALGQGKVASKAMEGIARNPEAASKLFTPLIISLALIETLVIYALTISILIQLKI